MQDEKTAKLLQDIAIELTMLTGEVFSLCNTERRTALEGQTAYIHAYLRTWPKPARLAFSPTSPEGVREYFNASTITCNPKRTAEAIARDIRNRILDEAREFHIKNSAHHARKMAELAAHREAVAPFEAEGFQHIRHMENDYHARLWVADVTVDITDDKVEFKARNLTGAQALQLFHIVEEFKTKWESHYYTLYRVAHTDKHFFKVYERLTGNVVHTGATYDTAGEADTAAQEVTAEYIAQAARDEEEYLKSIQQESNP